MRVLLLDNDLARARQIKADLLAQAGGWVIDGRSSHVEAVEFLRANIAMPVEAIVSAGRLSAGSPLETLNYTRQVGAPIAFLAIEEPGDDPDRAGRLLASGADEVIPRAEANAGATLATLIVAARRRLESRLRLAASSGEQGLDTTRTRLARTRVALQKSHEQLAFALETANDGLWDWDLRSDEVCFSPRFFSTLGYEASDAVAKAETWKRLIHPDDLDRVTAVITSCLDGPSHPRPAAAYEIEFRVRDRGGEWRWMLGRGQVTERDDTGRPVRLVSVHFDITNAKRAEAALRQSEERYRSLFENSPISLWEEDHSRILTFLQTLRDKGLTDLRAYFGRNPEALGRSRALIRVLDVNAATLSLFRAPSKPVLLERLPDIFGPAADGAMLETALAFAEGRRTLTVERELRTLAGDAVHLFMSLSVAPGCEETLSRVLVSYLDVTDRVRAQQAAEDRRRQLVQADKMISLGVLTAGVAHEINNPNNFIMLNAPLLGEAWASARPILDEYAAENGDFNMAGLPWSDIRDHLPALCAGISEGSERIMRIVQSLKDFARDEPPETKLDLDVNAVLKAALMLCANITRKSTRRLSVNYGDDLPPIYGNFQQLEQVFLNLIHNACQALSGPDRAIAIVTEHDGQQGVVIIEVCDEGEGIAPGRLDRIRDPFFTTRRDIGGVGLGVSISAQIVHEHGGTLEYVSEVGRGTTARVVLPTKLRRLA